MTKRIDANWHWPVDEAELRAARRREFWAGVRRGYAIGAFLWAVAAVACAFVYIGWKL